MCLVRINQIAAIMMAATMISARTIPTATPAEELSLPAKNIILSSVAQAVGNDRSKCQAALNICNYKRHILVCSF
jgi:hypothetical protein